MESNLQYAQKSYWDKRFETEDNFEWLTEFDSFKHLILPHLQIDSRILHIGCGSSQMSMRLHELGYTNIVNVDYSQVLVDAGSTRYPYMDWVCDDIRSLEKVPSGSVDIVLEKATIEALLVAEKSQWDPSDYALETLECIFKAVQRVLKPSGKFLSISFTQPHFRVPAFYRVPKWNVEVSEFGDSFHYYLYVCHLEGDDATTDVAASKHSVRDRYAAIAPSWGRSLLLDSATEEE